MFWRASVILITLFWAVMATLLVRVTYYPEGSQFARLEPREVFKIFLDRSVTLSTNTLHVYHGEKKLGHAMLTPRRQDAGPGRQDYFLVLTGVLDRGAFEGLNSAVAWKLSLRLLGGDRWGGASGQVRLPEEAKVLDFEWPEASPAPKFALRDHGVLLVDDSALQAMRGPFAAGTPAAPAGVPADGEGFVKVKAREGSMKIAGQKRKGFVIEFLVTEHYRVRAFFTETGELAVVELPDGYRAVEPVIHGLVPDDPDEEVP